MAASQQRPLLRAVSMLMPCLRCSPLGTRATARSLRASCLLPAEPSQMPALARFYSDSPAEAASENPRSFAAFTIYKTKGAMRASIIAPSWKSIAAKGALIGTVPGEVLDREGVLLLEFANANPRAAQSMDRTYNWQDKTTFALKAVELGRIFSHSYGAQAHAGNSGDAVLSILHDAGKASGTSQAMKTLKVAPADRGHMFTLTAKDASGNSKQHAVVVEAGEWYTLKSIADRAIPALLGLLPY